MVVVEDEDELVPVKVIVQHDDLLHAVNVLHEDLVEFAEEGNPKSERRNKSAQGQMQVRVGENAGV